MRDGENKLTQMGDECGTGDDEGVHGTQSETFDHDEEQANRQNDGHLGNHSQWQGGLIEDVIQEEGIQEDDYGIENDTRGTDESDSLPLAQEGEEIDIGRYNRDARAQDDQARF